MLRNNNGLVDHNQKPIYCITNDQYYSTSSEACKYLLLLTQTEHNARALRRSIERGQNYKGNKFIFISRKEFNKAKSEFPEKCHGNFFNIKEDIA